MQIYPIVNEGTGAKLTVAFYDENGDAEVPDSVEYRVDSLEPRTAIRDWTTLSPAESIEITLTSEDNEVQNRRKQHETHVVTVRAGYAGGTEYANDAYEYKVKNLQFISS